MAVILNGSHVIVQPINFFKVNSHYLGLWVNFLGGLERILRCFLSCLFSGPLFSLFFVTWLFNSYQNIIGRALEHLSSKTVNLGLMLVIKIREGFKGHSI